MSITFETIMDHLPKDLTRMALEYTGVSYDLEKKNVITQLRQNFKEIIVPYPNVDSDDDEAWEREIEGKYHSTCLGSWDPEDSQRIHEYGICHCGCDHCDHLMRDCRYECAEYAQYLQNNIERERVEG